MLVSACGAGSHIIVKLACCQTESPIEGLMPMFTADSGENSGVEVSMGASPTVSQQIQQAVMARQVQSLHMLNTLQLWTCN